MVYKCLKLCFIIVQNVTKWNRVVYRTEDNLEIILGATVQQIVTQFIIGEQTVDDLKKKKNELLQFLTFSDSLVALKQWTSMKKKNLEWVRPVSYTHLDVYKRQTINSANNIYTYIFYLLTQIMPLTYRIRYTQYTYE